MKDFTIEDARKSITEFRTFLGQKSFWAKTSEIREQAIKGLSHVYLTYDSTGVSKDDQLALAEQYVSVIEEYQRRELMILRLAITR